VLSNFRFHGGERRRQKGRHQRHLSISAKRTDRLGRVGPEISPYTVIRGQRPYTSLTALSKRASVWPAPLPTCSYRLGGP